MKSEIRNVLITLVGIGIILFVIGLTLYGEETSKKLGLEFTKSGLQLFVVVILGGLLTFVFEDHRRSYDQAEVRRDAEQTRRQELNGYQKEKLRELVSTNNDVRIAPVLIAGARSALTYGQQMRNLIDARLRLSLLRHEIEAAGKKENTVFSNWPTIKESLEPMERYLENLGKEYTRYYKNLSESQKAAENNSISHQELWKEILALPRLWDMLHGAGVLEEENEIGKEQTDSTYDKEYLMAYKKIITEMRKEIWANLPVPPNKE